VKKVVLHYSRAPGKLDLLLTKSDAKLFLHIYGVSGDLVNEYLRTSETAFVDSMFKFCKAVIGVFGDVCLREPNVADTTRILSINKGRGFLGCLEHAIWYAPVSLGFCSVTW
jgi:hypothetical protein